MLHASSKGGLLKSLGEGRFKQNMFFTSQVSRSFHETESMRGSSALRSAAAMIEIH